MLCLLLFFAEAYAQNPTSVDQTRPVINAQQINQAPSIDGRLDEAAWGEALAISEFYQKEPLEGQAATEQTQVRILYDRGYLYFGIELQQNLKWDIHIEKVVSKADLVCLTESSGMPM